MAGLSAEPGLVAAGVDAGGGTFPVKAFFEVFPLAVPPELDEAGATADLEESTLFLGASLESLGVPDRSTAAGSVEEGSSSPSLSRSSRNARASSFFDFADFGGIVAVLFSTKWAVQDGQYALGRL